MGFIYWNYIQNQQATKYPISPFFLPGADQKHHLPEILKNLESFYFGPVCCSKAEFDFYKLIFI